MKKSPPQKAIEQQIVEGIGKALWWLISWPFRRGQSGRSGLLSATVAGELAQHFKQVVLVQADQPATWNLAISEADKLLDHAFLALALPGQSMGERLKVAGERGLFGADLYNQVWTAHKLRNRLAHEVGVVINGTEKTAVIGIFQAALRALGVFV